MAFSSSVSASAWGSGSASGSTSGSVSASGSGLVSGVVGVGVAGCRGCREDLARRRGEERYRQRGPGRRREQEVGHPPVAADGEHPSQQQRSADRPERACQVPGRHPLLVPRGCGVHQGRLRQADERARRREEGDERDHEDRKRVGSGHGRQRASDDHATGDHKAVPGPALPGDQAKRQLDQASDQHGNRDQQADLGVAQPEIGADQRERGALRPVGQLIDELDRQRNRNGCDAQEPAMSAIAAVRTTTKRAQAAQKPTRAGCGVSDRSTSHVPIVNAARPPRHSVPAPARHRSGPRPPRHRSTAPSARRSGHRPARHRSGPHLTAKLTIRAPDRRFADQRRGERSRSGRHTTGCSHLPGRFGVGFHGWEPWGVAFGAGRGPWSGAVAGSDPRRGWVRIR